MCIFPVVDVVDSLNILYLYQQALATHKECVSNIVFVYSNINKGWFKKHHCTFVYLVHYTDCLMHNG